MDKGKELLLVLVVLFSIFWLFVFIMELFTSDVFESVELKNITPATLTIITKIITPPKVLLSYYNPLTKELICYFHVNWHLIDKFLSKINSHTQLFIVYLYDMRMICARFYIIRVR